MQYNYILLNEGFYRWLETNYLPIGSQILFLKLIHLFNLSSWSEWLAVDNQRMASLVQTKREQSAIQWRNKLLENNLIVYVKGKKGLPNKYKLNDKLAFIGEAKSVVNSEVKTVVQSVAIDKQNKTKQNKKEITANTVSKKQFGKFGNVLLTEAEYERLKSDYGETFEGVIDYFSEYIEMKGYKAKSHNLAIRNWVVTAYREKIQREIALKNREKVGELNAINGKNIGVKREFKEYPEYDTYQEEYTKELAAEIRRIKEQCASEQSIC